jgi:hypothetical protein
MEDRVTEPRLEQLDNPAARVEAVLIRAQPHTGSEANALDEWQAVFGADTPEDVAQFTAEFITQLQLAREAIERLPESEDPEHLLKYFSVLDNLPRSMLMMAGLPMSAFSRFMTDEIIYSLAGCSRALRRNGAREPTFDSDALIELLGMVAKIIDEVAESDVPTYLKLFITQRLQEVETALRLYRISGYARVEYSLDGLVGATWRAPEEAKKQTGNWILRIIAKVQGFARGSAELAKSTQTVIESVQSISGN